MAKIPFESIIATFALKGIQKIAIIWNKAGIELVTLCITIVPLIILK